MLLWFVLLIFQNAAFTWVGRARNSGSMSYHAIASVFSNSVWFVSQYFFISFMVKPDMPLKEFLTIAVIYTAGTVIGSVAMHAISLKFLESGKRAVGAR